MTSDPLRDRAIDEAYRGAMDRRAVGAGVTGHAAAERARREALELAPSYDVDSPALVNVLARGVLAFAAALRDLHNEVDCRIEHGANSGGHLEYVRDRLSALATADTEKP